MREEQKGKTVAVDVHLHLLLLRSLLRSLRDYTIVLAPGS